MVTSLSEGGGRKVIDKRIQDVMVPLEEYPCIPETLTLRDAIIEMGMQILRTQLPSLPRVVLVFNDNDTRLLGILRRRDIMRGLEPRFMLSGSLNYRRKLFNVEVDPNLSELSHEKTLEGMRRRANRLVKDYMLPIKATIDYNDHVTTAVYEMVDQNVSLLPVMKNGNVVGVVRSVDVLSEIALVI